MMTEKQIEAAELALTAQAARKRKWPTQPDSSQTQAPVRGVSVLLYVATALTFAVGVLSLIFSSTEQGLASIAHIQIGMGGLATSFMLLALGFIARQLSEIAFFAQLQFKGEGRPS